MKEKGILLPIFSLPGKYGIGDFGNEAYEFIDILSKNNITYWEILPINSCNGLPYSPISYYALDERYISIDKLIENGLLESAEYIENTGRAVDVSFKEKYYKKAFEKFGEDDKYKEFIQSLQIKQYAEYMSDKTGEIREYYLFLQYVTYSQWIDLKLYANSKNVKIIGDMPVYPLFDSVETKYNSKYFEMENGKFTFEAGTPPDYFSEDGQKWNCPVYNVEHIKADNYKYLIDRYKYYLKIFDKVRVDYFRGYDSFFKIPYGKTGKEGFYADGVSYGFFDELFKNEDVKKENLIIEDLGDIREETVALRDYYGFTRQKILQFTIDLENLKDNDNECENVLVFPANHDCPTMLGWLKNMSDENKNRFKLFLQENNCDDKDINVGIMQYCMKCKANMIVITMQDILGLDDSARINLPGVDKPENWSWRMKDFEEFKQRAQIYGNVADETDHFGIERRSSSSSFRL